MWVGLRDWDAVIHIPAVIITKWMSFIAGITSSQFPSRLRCCIEELKTSRQILPIIQFSRVEKWLSQGRPVRSSGRTWEGGLLLTESQWYLYVSHLSRYSAELQGLRNIRVHDEERMFPRACTSLTCILVCALVHVRTQTHTHTCSQSAKGKNDCTVRYKGSWWYRLCHPDMRMQFLTLPQVLFHFYVYPEHSSLICKKRFLLILYHHVFFCYFISSVHDSLFF